MTMVQDFGRLEIDEMNHRLAEFFPLDEGAVGSNPAIATIHFNRAAAVYIA
jgi:hypothetical protein